MVKGYSIDFLENTYQTRKNPNAKFMLPQEILVEQEINDLLEMGAIQKAIYQKNQFVSHLFLVSKKSWRQRSVINLKELSQLIPYHHFKIEGLYLLKKILEKGDYLRKLHLKDSYFCVIILFNFKLCISREPVILERQMNSFGKKSFINKDYDS